MPHVRALVTEGLSLQRANRASDAAERYGRALALDPNCFDALQLLGVLRFRGGDCRAGIELFTHALTLHPEHAPTLNNLGNALREAGRLEEAIAAYRRAVGLLDKPPAMMFCNLGSALLNSGDPRQAQALLEQAATLEPQNSLPWCWLGHHARATNRAGDAIRFYQQALRLESRLAEAQRGLASAYRDCDRCVEAVAAFDRTLALEPAYAVAHLGRAEARLCLADWTGFDADADRIAHAAPKPGELLEPMKPMLFTDDALALRRYADAAAAFYAGMRTGSAAPAASGAPSAPRRLRVGYLSTDLREHPVGRLLAGVVESHDHEAFDIRLFALGAPDDSYVRRRLAAAVEPTVLGTPTDQALIAELRAARLDILVDLMGYTLGHRARVLAARVAPVQVTWLGYPGTLGGSIADYLIADAFAIPEGAEDAYAERLVRLPDCLLPGDRSRAVDEAEPRAAYGLPAEAVVLCAFNQTRKLNPRVFDLWMDVLRAVPDTVLWLSEERAEANVNLRAAAQARGVAPERLVFAPRMPSLAAHLARLRCADLALDTFPYGAHSAAIDALWAGCPLIAWVGRSLPARVSGSILRAAGLAELAAQSAEEYRALILALARDAPRRAHLRERLAVSREQSALFDAQRFTRSLERAYRAMAERSQLGLPPEHLWIH
jgi:protein O-GlcNAc transferase